MTRVRSLICGGHRDLGNVAYVLGKIGHGERLWIYRSGIIRIQGMDGANMDIPKWFMGIAGSDIIDRMEE